MPSLTAVQARPGDRERLAVPVRLMSVVNESSLPTAMSVKPPPISPSRQLRAGQVAEDPDPLAHQLSGGADRLDRRSVAVAVGMGEVEAQDVGAGRDQPLQRRRLRRWRARRWR